MRIDRLEIKGFGKLKNRLICFERGINVIYGANEAGKSTLLLFIRGMLYGLKGYGQARKGMPQYGKRFTPWDGGQYGGAMVYTLDDGNTYRVERDFEKDTVKLFDNHFNDITDRFARGRDRQPVFADRQLGLDAASFERTALIKQFEVRLDESGSAELASKLANARSSGRDDISFGRAEKALAEALINCIGTERTTSRPLDRLEARLSQLEASRAKLRKKCEITREYRKELAALRNERRLLEVGLEHLDRIAELVAIRKSLDENLKYEVMLKEAAGNLDSLEETLKEAEVVGVCKEAAGGRYKEVAGDARKRIGGFVFATVSVICFILFVYFVFSDIKRTADYQPILSAVYGAGTVIAGAASMLLFMRSGVDRRMSAAYGKTAELLDEIKRVCGNASLILGKRLEDPGAVRREIQEIAKKLSELSRRLESGIEAAAARLLEYSAVDFPEDALANTLANSIFFSPEGLDVTLYDYETSFLEDTLKKEKGDLERRLFETALREKYYEGLVNEEPDDEEELQRVEEETVAVMEKISYLKRKGDALRLAKDVLAEAGAEIRRSFAPELDSAMSLVIAGLTGGRYTDLRGDDRLALKAVLPENGDIKDALMLSGATADQMYLALRLAMACILTAEGESIPILMDEAFSHFDDNRTELALGYLQKSYHNRQVLIFTCKMREVEIAREICGKDLNLVELDVPLA